MRVLISAEGHHKPAGHHLMMVDGHQFLIDLSGVRGTLVDPTILRVEWGMTVFNGEAMEAGEIVRRGGHKQMFFDKAVIEPYLTAWRDKAAHLHQDQVAFQEAVAERLALEALEALADGPGPLSDDQAFGPVVLPGWLPTTTSRTILDTQGRPALPE